MKKTLLGPKYNHREVEKGKYQEWLAKDYFTSGDLSKKPYCIVIPPPNVTGVLHLGHAWDTTLQDIISRRKRMQGYDMLWLPGMDHAGIATQAKIDAKLKSQGISRYDLGRDAFLTVAWEWKEEYAAVIRSQWAALGLSLDYNKERFTLDEGLNKAVTKVFMDLYRDGLIYRGERIINWDVQSKTALSNIEVEYKEIEGAFYHFIYPFVNRKGGLEIATTRPETMFGDVALMVHPEDERYQQFIGEMVYIPGTKRAIPVISDAYVDREFGTGVVKVTPAHDPNDFEVGSRHDLPIIRVMNDDGSMNVNAGKYESMDRYEARKAIVEDLKGLGLLVKIEEHKHNVGECYRCSTTVEPIVSKQWFVKMKPLAEPAIDVVRSGEIKFVPQRFEKTYFNWMENVRDWCISRQLWWGHRIPAYYCEKCGETVVAKEMPTKCSCGHDQFKQDEDVLDTWFSSALWPFSTLGWPEETEEVKYFYPTSVLVTGYDIIFFWVARMIFSGLEHMGEIPFDDVLFHGIVRDSQGRKMSKSLGNGIDPLEVIDEYGADSLRMSLIIGNTPGNDMRFNYEKVEANRNFANKIWNATRFILMNLENMQGKALKPDKMEIADQWIISRYERLVGEVTDNLNKYELGLAAQKIHDFTWNEYCDWYIELVKPRLYGSDDSARGTALYTLVYVLSNTLKLLHPFMPFITEELWQHLPHEGESIMISSWPTENKAEINKKAEDEMHAIMDAIRSIRNIRAEMEVAPSKKAKLIIVAEPQAVSVFENAKLYLEKLASASEVMVQDSKEGIPANAVSVVTDKAQIFIPLEDLIDFDKEMERLAKEKENLEKELSRVNGKLSNEKFVSKAPEAVVQEEREKKEKYQNMMDKVLEQISNMEKMKTIS